LSAARQQLTSLRSHLAKLQAAQLAAVTGFSGSSAQRSSSGGFTFPMPKGDVSPPGTWSPDDGVDIAAPGGTPEFAVCSGTLVLHGIGGFGPSAPVLHCDSPLAGYSYVYYGHAGPGNWVPVGTHLGQGQVISQVGYGIVGISTGPHLEIGFADSSGGPVGPSSAPAMMSLLQAAYGA
jgi:murein DD-endopeptidase MepM/ murein hydrolase activator NlpD